ncbi:unnamed protein product, partial [Didymodactylos carnosus]
SFKPIEFDQNLSSVLEWKETSQITDKAICKIRKINVNFNSTTLRALIPASISKIPTVIPTIYELKNQEVN